ncbi:MAG: PilW family protein [Pseudomonadota bacterium]
MNNTSRNKTSRNKRNSKGLSLVEMMISLALGSIVTVGVIQLFVANSESYNLLQGQSRMQEAARFGLNFIGSAARQAGYAGCFSSLADLYPTIDPAFMPYEMDMRSGVHGFNAVGANWVPALTMLPNTDAGNEFPAGGDGVGNGIDITQIVQGTDVLTLRNMGLEDFRLVASLPTSTEPIVVAGAIADLGFGEDHLAMIHDCEKATLFRVTSLAESAGQTTIGHLEGDPDNYTNTTDDLTLINNYEDDAAVSRIESSIFFIAPGSGFNEAGQNPLSLWRKNGVEAPAELIEGVEDLQVLYGVDTDLDGVPNQYLPANLVTDFNEVETIRVTLVVNSVDDIGGTSTPTHGCVIQNCISGETFDGLIRRSFTQTFQLRN